ncbi:MAG: hypothetical protein ACK44E_08735 [Anaerolineales bacterium]
MTRLLSTVPLLPLIFARLTCLQGGVLLPEMRLRLFGLLSSRANLLTRWSGNHFALLF